MTPGSSPPDDIWKAPPDHVGDLADQRRSQAAGPSWMGAPPLEGVPRPKRRPMSMAFLSIVIALILVLLAVVVTHVVNNRSRDHQKREATIAAASIPGTRHDEPTCLSPTWGTGCYVSYVHPIEGHAPITEEEIDRYETSIGWKRIARLSYEKGRLRADISLRGNRSGAGLPAQQAISVRVDWLK